MTQQWRSFDWGDIPALTEPVEPARPASAGSDAGRGERPCPACGVRAVRAYHCEVAGARRPTLLSYIWCTACRRFVGARRPWPAGAVVPDPLAGLAGDDRRALERSVETFLAHLDELWNTGV